jgi:hypothetical protein
MTKSCRDHCGNCSEVEEMRYVYCCGGEKRLIMRGSINRFWFSGPVFTIK